MPKIVPKGQTAVMLEVVNENAPHRFGPQLRSGGAVNADGLIATQGGGAVDRTRLRGVGFYVGTVADDEERAGLCNAAQPRKVDVAAIHHQITAG